MRAVRRVSPATWPPGPRRQPGNLTPMSVEASGKNMGLIVKARDQHDRSCPYGGKATAVEMSYFDIERLGWEEGDQIAGLTIVGDAKRQPYSIRVTCDAEPKPDLQEEEETEDVLDAVATQELQPVGPSVN